jgi:hypothetical protein
MEYDPLNYGWDHIFEELKTTLKREPENREIQEELLRKYWNSLEAMEKK